MKYQIGDGSIFFINKTISNTPYEVMCIDWDGYRNRIKVRVINRVKNRKTLCSPQVLYRILREFFGLDVRHLVKLQKNTISSSTRR